MGKNSSVNGEVMFKFDASKFNIYDGNVTFWVWSPDIPSLGSVPIPASSTQGSAQSQTGNAAKLGYIKTTEQSDSYYYTTTAPAYKSPRIELKVTESKAFQIIIAAKLLDSYDKPIPNRELLVKIMLFPPKEKKISDNVRTGTPSTSSNEYIYNGEIRLRTNDRGEIRFYTKLKVPPYIKFAMLHVFVGLNEKWNGYWPNQIYNSLNMPVGKWVTILTDNIDNILNLHSSKFRRTTEKVEKIDDLTITTYRYFAEVNKLETVINFKVKIGPNHTRTGIEETKFNFIMDLNNKSDKDAIFVKIFNKRLQDDIKYYINDIDDESLKRMSVKNAIFRTMFKRGWQLSYTEWDFGEVKYAYKEYILGLKKWSSVAERYMYKNISDKGLRKYLSKYLDNATGSFPSPANLYSLTLSSGDYRYILVALLGSIFAITQSLGLGLNQTKEETRNSLEKNQKDEEFMYQVIIEILVGIAFKVIAAIVEIYVGPWVHIIFDIISHFVSKLISNYVIQEYVQPKYSYLRAQAYSPLKLLRLIEIINYDLSLLNFEIKVWDQLSDGTKWGGGKSYIYYY